MKVVLITGCSSGIGLLTAVLLAKNNYKVYATVRNPEKATELQKQLANTSAEILPLDVTQEDSIHDAVQKILEKENKIDILINNAGYGLFGGVETVTLQQAQDQFNTNFFGVIRVLQAVLPAMRKQRSGHIINISSIVGIVGVPGMDLYVASKHALEGLTESMLLQLRTFGINVTLIEPGPVKTYFNTSSMKSGEREIPDYAELTEKAKERLSTAFTIAQDPAEVAQSILQAIEHPKQAFRVQTSDVVKERAGTKLKDPSGKNILDSL